MFAFELQEARKRSKSAATNELGHQKTPQFISAVVHRSVALVVVTKGTRVSLLPTEARRTLQEQSVDLRASIGGFVDAFSLQTKQYVLPQSSALQQPNRLSAGVEILSPTCW